MPAPKRRTTRRRSRAAEADPQLQAVGEDRAGLHLRARRAHGRRRRGAPPSRPARTCARRGGRSTTRDRRGRASAGGRPTALLRWHFVQAGHIKNTELLVAALHLDGVQGDRRVHHPADLVHRERGHEPEGGARRRAQVRRRARLGAALRVAARSTRGDTQTFYALASQLKILTYFNLGHDARQLEDVAGDQGADPHAPGRRHDVGRRDRQQGQHGRLRRRPHARRALRRHRGLQGGPLHRPQQLGHRAGATRASRYASLDYAQAAFTEAYGVQV